MPIFGEWIDPFDGETSAHNRRTKGNQSAVPLHQRECITAINCLDPYVNGHYVILRPQRTMIASTAATAAVAAPPEPAGADRELKFSLPNSRVDQARRWLDTICQRDPEFPSAVVWTIYYDTPGLASLGEKINSDYLKRKLRLRWYSNLEGQPTGPAFVEAKMRNGNRRSKVRVRLPHPAEDLNRWDLQDPRLRAFPSFLREQGIVIGIGENWLPLLQIRYRRDRFIEPVSRARVSLDGDIAATAINPAIFSFADYSAIESAVLEVKGHADHLPIALHPLLQLGARKASFSKFLAIYAHVTRRIF